MNFQESVKTCFSKYADFSGTASRPEYWWFALFVFVASIVISSVSPILSGLFSLATLLPAIAAATRRLHDTQRSGWWHARQLYSANSGHSGAKPSVSAFAFASAG